MNTIRTYSRFKVAGTILVMFALCTVGFLMFAQQHSLHREAEARKAEVEAGPRVKVIVAGGDEGARVLRLQGESLPYASTTLYAKVSGFLREIRVDKGSAVRQGQVLAILQSAEVDRDTQALKADAENKRRDADRLHELGRQGIVSARDEDAADSAARIAQEKLASQSVVQGYQNVVAPFSGVVTDRYVDHGAMIQNGGNSSAVQPIVSLAQVDRLRVVFYLDQGSAHLAKVGQEVEVRPSERPDVVRTARISRLAGALDPRTRTLLVEGDLDNRDGAFLPGGYVRVALKLAASENRLDIPSEALVQKGEKTFAVVVGDGSTIRLQPILLGEDEGGRVRVLQGLKPGDRVVLNPGQSLRDGDRVQVAEGKS